MGSTGWIQKVAGVLRGRPLSNRLSLNSPEAHLPPSRIQLEIVPGQRAHLDDNGERFIPNGRLSDIAFEHCHRYLLAARLANNRRVLDVACGEGYGTSLLAQVAKSVVGVDLSEAVIDHARSTYGRFGAKFVTRHCGALPVESHSIDLVVSFETIEHISDPASFLSEIRRVLSPSGILIISTPDRETYSRSNGSKPNNFHLAEMSAVEFETALRRQFPHVSLYGQRVTYGSFVWPTNSDSARVVEPTFENTDHAISTFELGADAAPVYMIAIASDALHPFSGLSLVEIGKFFNPIASLLGGIADRDAEIIRLKQELNLRSDNGIQIPENQPLEAQSGSDKNRSLIVDLAEPIPGTGWYEPEFHKNGVIRWTGPLRQFSLELPLDSSFSFKAKIKFTSIRTFGTNDLTVLANGIKLPMHLQPDKNCYIATFEVPQFILKSDGSHCLFDFEVSSVSRPVDAGEAELRYLGVAVMSIEFLRSA